MTGSTYLCLLSAIVYRFGVISIRLMTTKDVPASQELLRQLGYPLDRDELGRRYASVTGAKNHALFVADDGSRVLALCHVYARPALDKPPEAVVQALVVDNTARSAGVGKAMMATAEAWASDQGFTSLVLGSNVARLEAHAFYERIGYQRAATSHLFRKALSRNS